MVYGTVERQEGNIEVESTLGHGTCFRLIFPVRQITPAQQDQPAEPEPVRPLHILCIDDDPLVRNFMLESLSHFHHDVSTADCGRQGVEMFLAAQKERPFEVVITDLGMPEMDGRQVASAVKAQSPRTPVILLTGWGMIMKEESDVPGQVDAVLAKPPRLRELNSTLTRVMGMGTAVN
jgi:CheY-like chemotaxis protein